MKTFFFIGKNLNNRGKWASKVWKIERKGSILTMWWGPAVVKKHFPEQKGKLRRKTLPPFPDDETATAYEHGLIREKLGKGYEQFRMVQNLYSRKGREDMSYSFIPKFERVLMTAGGEEFVKACEAATEAQLRHVLENGKIKPRRRAAIEVFWKIKAGVVKVEPPVAVAARMEQASKIKRVKVVEDAPAPAPVPVEVAIKASVLLPVFDRIATLVEGFCDVLEDMDKLGVKLADVVPAKKKGGSSPKKAVK